MRTIEAGDATTGRICAWHYTVAKHISYRTTKQYDISPVLHDTMISNIYKVQTGVNYSWPRQSRHSGSESVRQPTVYRFRGTLLSSFSLWTAVFMRQQSSLGADTSREPVPKMAAIVPQVQSSPKSNGNTTDSNEVPDTVKSNKVVRDFEQIHICSAILLFLYNFQHFNTLRRYI